MAYDDRAKITMRVAYEDKKRNGEISLTVNKDPVAALRAAYQGGKRFDLAFSDLPTTADRMNYLQALQAVLADGGYAAVPIEDYLAQNFPDAFQVTYPAGMKALIVHGTKSPVQLPAFDAEIRTTSEVEGSHVSVKWTPK